MEEVICVYKDRGWTSFDVVNKLKHALKKIGITKIGHAGTLDPMATGLLIVLVGKGTKRFDEFQNCKKEYIAEITFGIETDTYDAEGNSTKKYEGEVSFSKEEIENELRLQTGKVSQIPPVFSAKKVQGKRAYDLARRGAMISLTPKIVTIYEAELLTVFDNKVTVRYVVSSGTYIRSLAHDLGKVVGFGAHLSSLLRTKIGVYTTNDARKINDIISDIENKKVDF